MQVVPSRGFLKVGAWRKTKEEHHEWLVVRSLRATVRQENAEQTEQVVCNMIRALKLVTNLITGNKIGAEVKSVTESI